MENGLVRFQNDFLFFQAKREELKKAHPNKFVAIVDKDIKGIGDSVEDVTKKLKKMNIDPSIAVIEFVPKKEIIMVL